MNEQTAPEWRDCADPDELAAAVAAGVEDDPKGCPSCGLHWADGQIETVCAAPRGGGYHRVCHACGAEWDDSRFGYGVKEAYLRSQPPTSWTWRPEPPAPDDLAARATDECTLSPDRVGSPAGNDHPVTIPPADDLASLAETWRVRSDRLIRWAGDPAPQDADKVQFWLGAAAAYREAIADIDDGRPASELFTPPPVPPWPGAVLSGLCDEDGVPTWLAQAPNVQGEAVRTCVDFPWFICGSDNAVTPYWVEVRAPRAVPEPETERVPAWEAVKDGRRVVGASEPFEAHYIWRSGPDRAFIGERTMDRAVLIAPDGTVEVLKDES